MASKAQWTSVCVCVCVCVCRLGLGTLHVLLDVLFIRACPHLLLGSALLMCTTVIAIIYVVLGMLGRYASWHDGSGAVCCQLVPCPDKGMSVWGIRLTNNNNNNTFYLFVFNRLIPVFGLWGCYKKNQIFCFWLNYRSL